MANIAIDARLYGTEHTGLGRYTMNVLSHLPKYLKKHQLHVLLRPKYYSSLTLPNNCHKVSCDIPHYSFSEQVSLPSVLSSLHADLLYTFHFNAPIFSRLPTIVTVHDLIKSYFTGQDTTTRSPWLYRLKRLGYQQVLTRTLTQAQDIIVPTNTVKNQILANFPQVQPERLHPIPEAPDPIFRSKAASFNTLPATLNLPDKYLLYVGNAYPHKNLKILLDAFRNLKDPSLHLVIVSKRTPFLSRTLAPYEVSRIHVFSELTDQALVAVYRLAHVLVTPSLMEGYGLVGLEALMVGTRVLASNIPVYREVYGQAVTFFDPHSVTDLVSKLKLLVQSAKSTPSELAITKRTWDDVAQTIAEVIDARCTRL